MGVVSARIADEDEAILRKAKVNVSEIARNALHEEAQRLVRLDAMRRLIELGRKSKPSRTGETSEQIVREMRDAE